MKTITIPLKVAEAILNFCELPYYAQPLIDDELGVLQQAIDDAKKPVNQRDITQPGYLYYDRVYCRSCARALDETIINDGEVATFDGDCQECGAPFKASCSVCRWFNLVEPLAGAHCADCSTSYSYQPSNEPDWHKRLQQTLHNL